MVIIKRTGYCRRPKNPYDELVEFVLYNHKKIEQEIMLARMDNHGNRCGPKLAVSTPTENIALKNIEPLRCIQIQGRFLRKPETWMEWYSILIKSLEGIQADLVCSRYEKHVRYDKFCEEYHISQGTYQYLLKDIRSYGVMIAIEMGLVSIVNHPH